MGEVLAAPFSWFGNKRNIAEEVWKRLGNCDVYIEPFAGSLAVLFANPRPAKLEIVNDINGYLANFWRSIRYDPETVAGWADEPINETNLHARHKWLRDIGPDLAEKLAAQPEFYNAKAAGWWAWGASQWIGCGWCDDNAVWQTKPKIYNTEGIFKLRNNSEIEDYLIRLSNRLSNTRVLCGDWERVFVDHALESDEHIAVFLDPPYENTIRDNRMYVGDKNSESISARVRAWCLRYQHKPNLKIALCGYEGEHMLPDTWEVLSWKARGGYSSLGDDPDSPAKQNAYKERIWFSPTCNTSKQLALL